VSSLDDYNTVNDDKKVYYVALCCDVPYNCNGV